MTARAELVKRIAIASVMMFGGASAIAGVPAAHAADNAVTYEIVSNDVTLANVEYTDATGRKVQNQVPLPWRMTVSLADPKSPTNAGAEVRSDWRTQSNRYRWVTVRILLDGKVICENTLNVGNATCYGSVPHTG